MATTKKANLEEVKQLVETGEVPVEEEKTFASDVQEIVDIYGEVEELVELAHLSNKLTSEDIQKMATTIFIERNRHRVTTAPTPAKIEFQTADKVESENWECPGCHDSLAPRHSQNGKKYYSCKTCKSFINTDKQGKKFLVSWDDAKRRTQ